MDKNSKKEQVLRRFLGGSASSYQYKKKPAASASNELESDAKTRPLANSASASASPTASTSSTATSDLSLSQYLSLPCEFDRAKALPKPLAEYLVSSPATPSLYYIPDWVRLELLLLWLGLGFLLNYLLMCGLQVSAAEEKAMLEMAERAPTEKWTVLRRRSLQMWGGQPLLQGMVLYLKLLDYR